MEQQQQQQNQNSNNNNPDQQIFQNVNNSIFTLLDNPNLSQKEQDDIHDDIQMQENIIGGMKIKRDEFRVNIRKQNTQLDLDQRRKRLMNKRFNGQVIQPKVQLTEQQQIQFKETVREQQEQIKQTQKVDQQIVENLYKQLMEAYSLQNYEDLQFLCDQMFTMQVEQESDLYNTIVPLYIKCGIVDFIQNLTKDSSLLNQHYIVLYHSISSLANIASAQDDYVKTLMNNYIQIINQLLNLYQDCHDMKQIQEIFQQIRQNPQDINCLNQIESHLQLKLKQINLMSAIMFFFTNMIGSSTDDDLNLQVKMYLVNSNIIPIIIRGYQDIVYFQDFYSEFIMLTQNGQNIQSNVLKNTHPSKLEYIIDYVSTQTWFYSELVKGKNAKSWKPMYDVLYPNLMIIFDTYWNDNYLNEKIIQSLLFGFYTFLQINSNDFKIRQFMQILGKSRISRLIQKLGFEKNMNFNFLVLRILCNLLSGPDEVCQDLLDLNMLDALYILFPYNNSQIKSEIAWTMANICASSPNQIDKFLNHSIYNQMLSAYTSENLKVVNQIKYAVGNLLSSCNEAQIQEKLFKDLQFKEICVDTLKSNEKRIVLNTLDGFERILELFKGVYTQSGSNIMTMEFERFNFTTELEELQTHDDIDVYNRVNQIIEAYFITEDIEESYY